MACESQTLLLEIHQGDARALDTLLERHLPGLHAYVRLRAGRLVRAKEGSMDIVQSVCREVLQHADRFQFQGEGNFRQWLYKAALRKICDKHDYYKAAKRDVAKERVVGPDGEDLLVNQYRTICTPSRHAVAKEELARVENAFATLSEEHQEIILMARIMGLSRAEIGKALDKTPGAVRAMLHRALAELAQKLEIRDSP